MCTKSNASLRLCGIDTMLGLEPLPVPVYETDQGNFTACQLRCELYNFIVGLLGCGIAYAAARLHRRRIA